MKTLMQLELRKYDIRTYVVSVLVIAAAMLGFFYLFAYAPRLEPDDPDLAIFAGYANLIPLFGVLNMAVFGVLAAVMYAKFIIEDYTGKRVILLFSYPVSRTKMMLAKIGVVGLFTAASMAASNVIIYVIFSLSEPHLHLVSEAFTVSVLLRAVETTLLMALTAVCIGIAAAGIGWMNKSVSAAIVSAVLIASLVCNIVVNAASSRALLYLIPAAMMTAGALFSMMLVNKAKQMEVE